MVKRSAGDAEATPASMTLDEAYELLGVQETSASFDQILAAKNSLARKYEGDKDKIAQVCAPALAVMSCAMHCSWTAQMVST
jgi:hypothetical protein